MNWALEEAKILIEKNPNKEEFVLASGVSPSGFIHIGNFREVVTTYFVAHELKRLGKKVRFILSFDNFDRFRKVPKGIDESFNKYIGMPYTSIPSPFSAGKTYAKEMEDIFIEELDRLGIHPEIISQTEQYKSGRYIEKMKLAMKERRQIFDILSKYKTQHFTQEDCDNYYPINLYCEECGKDSTNIINYDEQTGNIEYKCTCGNHHIQNINTSRNIKLQWKIDWPMRWQAENVVFEPGGRDHSAENGSYVVSKEISEKIFNYGAPTYTAYDFIGIKGTNGKMASSSGNVLILSDLLRVYDKFIILWFYAKYKPSAEFSIALDDDVLRYYTEFDRMVRSYFNGKLDEKNSSILSLIDINEEYLNNPDFSMIANFLPMLNYNIDSLKSLLRRAKIDCDNVFFNSRLVRATNWLKEYGDDKKNTLLNSFNSEYYTSLSENEKEWIQRTVEILRAGYMIDELQTKLYAVVKEDVNDQSMLRKFQERYFQIIYNMLIGKDVGPKMGLFLSSIDSGTISHLLVKTEKKQH